MSLSLHLSAKMTFRQTIFHVLCRNSRNSCSSFAGSLYRCDISNNQLVNAGIPLICQREALSWHHSIRCGLIQLVSSSCYISVLKRKNLLPPLPFIHTVIRVNKWLYTHRKASIASILLWISFAMFPPRPCQPLPAFPLSESSLAEAPFSQLSLRDRSLEAAVNNCSRASLSQVIYP